MALTRREKLIDLLLHSEQPLAPSELARILEVDQKVVIEDLKRVERTLRNKGYELRVVLPKCKKCGRTIHMKGFNVPDRCPYCGSQWIEEPMFYVAK